jgi:hypothetical protein
MDSIVLRVPLLEWRENCSEKEKDKIRQYVYVSLKHYTCGWKLLEQKRKIHVRLSRQTSQVR